MSSNSSKKAGVIALIFSFLFPILGIIIYFINRKTVVNSSAYLYAALGGFILGIILRAMAGAY